MYCSKIGLITSFNLSIYLELLTSHNSEDMHWLPNDVLVYHITDLMFYYLATQSDTDPHNTALDVSKE